MDSLFILILYVLLPVVVGCVGPTTPFGAIDSFTPASDGSSSQREVASEAPRSKESINYKIPMIHFYPKRQVLHDKTNLEIEITDAESIPAHFGFKIYHNKRDVTQQFLATSTIEKSADNKTINFKFKDLRLRIEDMNNINVLYEKDNGEFYTAKYIEPTCSLFEQNRIANIHGFDPPSNYIELIESIAGRAMYNPNFLAGIVAQESGFNPRAVSWAKAIGLTQITSLAERELINRKKMKGKWPRFPGINKMHYLKLKAKILTGEIDLETEWRLNPRYSIQGGATYISYLKKYWDLENNKAILQSLPGDHYLNLSEVILASYNSGAARVKAAIVTKGDLWKSHKKLKEANKYVKKVSSYCYHFSTEDNS